MLLFERAMRLELLMLLVEDLLFQRLHPSGAHLVERLLAGIPTLHNYRLVH